MTDHRSYAAAALSLFVLAAAPAGATDKFKINILGTCAEPRNLQLVVRNEDQTLRFKEQDYRKDAWRHRWPEGLPLPDPIIASLRFDGARTNCYKPDVVADDEGLGNVNLITVTCVPHPVTSVTLTAKSPVSMRWERNLPKTKGSTNHGETDCHEFGGPADSSAPIFNVRFPDEIVWFRLFAATFLLHELDAVKNAKPGKTTTPIGQPQIIDAICRSQVQHPGVSNCGERISHDSRLDKLELTLTTVTTEP